MAEKRNIGYGRRNFIDVREGLINYIEQYYPNELKEFTDSSIGTTLIELIAGASDVLNYQIDRYFQETQLDYAQREESVRNLAHNLGLNIPGKRGSVTVVEFSVDVPIKGDSPDEDYLPIIKAGTSVTGGGKVFEVLEDIDFANPVSRYGLPNRKIIPNVDSNEILRSYTIVKNEVVFNGNTKIFPVSITRNNFKPFLQITLPDTNVLSIESVINKSGIGLSTPNMSEFYDEDIRFYEVDYLMEDRVFTENQNLSSASDTIKVGNWKKVSKKFIKEFNPNGTVTLTFGSGDSTATLFEDALSEGGAFNGLDNYLENTSLGELPTINSTVFIKYRVGGGINTNIGRNAITSLGTVFLNINGPKSNLNQQVRNSLRVTNPVPALGGADALTVDEIRYLAKYNFASQNRAVTLTDYLVTVNKMPGKFGSPFRVTTYKKDNKVVIPILGLDSNKKLNNTSNNLLKENIANYLAGYRMFNDYVEVTDGKIINLSTEFDLYIDENIVSSEIANNVILTIMDFFDISKRQMGDDLFLGSLIEQVNNITGVINVLSYRFFNKVGGQYSSNEIDMVYSNEETRQIQLVNNALYAGRDTMFEIKYPEKDIKLFLKKSTDI